MYKKQQLFEPFQSFPLPQISKNRIFGGGREGAFAGELRRNLTPAERKLWAALRAGASVPVRVFTVNPSEP